MREWLAGSRDRPLAIETKVASATGSWWLEEAFPAMTAPARQAVNR
jgi:hypothetical protein